MSIESLYNTTGTVEKRTKAQNATTGQPADTWANYLVNTPGRLDMARRGLIEVPDDIFAELTHIWFMKYDANIVEHDYRLVIGGNTYTIIIASDAGGAQHHLEIGLKRVV